MDTDPSDDADGSPYDWEFGIWRGELSFQLLRPLHPINRPLSAMPAWGAVLVLIWLPIGAVLTLPFRPELHTSPLQVIAFVVAVVFAGVITVLVNAALGMTAFWFTRITAVVNLVWTSNLLLSGRLVPVALLPEWARWVSSLLWFRWVWDFPIIVLIGPIDTGDIAVGLAMQVVWSPSGRSWCARRGTGVSGEWGGGWISERVSERIRPRAIVARHLQAHVLNELQYRTNFFLQLLQSASQVAGALVAIALIYERVDQLNGWTQPQLLAAIGVYTFLGGVMRAFVQPAMMRLMDDVQSGTFDFALTKPADAELLVTVRAVDIWQTLDIDDRRNHRRCRPRPAGWHDRSGRCAGVRRVADRRRDHLLRLAVDRRRAFWFVRIDFVDALYVGIFRAAQYPIGIYPAWLRVSLTIVIPLGIAVTAPSEAITSRLDVVHAAGRRRCRSAVTPARPRRVAPRRAPLLGREQLTTRLSGYRRDRTTTVITMAIRRGQRRGLISFVARWIRRIQRLLMILSIAAAVYRWWQSRQGGRWAAAAADRCARVPESVGPSVPRWHGGLRRPRGNPSSSALARSTGPA